MPLSLRFVVLLLIPLLVTPSTRAEGISSSTKRAFQKDLTVSAKVDSRGFIDVWQLRRDVALLEPFMADIDSARCFSEGDGGDETAALTPREKAARKAAAKRQAAEEARCAIKVAEEYQRYQRLLTRFNHTWLSLLSSAMQKGDVIAEVILRQCSTTAVIDRSHIESTCSESPERRALATKRLREIGFAPAIDYSRSEREYSTLTVLQDQAHVLQRFALGDFRARLVGRGIDGASTVADKIRLRRQFQLIDAVLGEARRAFTFAPRGEFQTSTFSELRLNRQPLTPGYMTWGRGLHYGGGSDVYTGLHEWRLGGEVAYISGSEERILTGGASDAVFMRELHDTLASAEATIDEWLQKDSRWGVFLIRRVGHHEWVPERVASEKGLLDRSWQGTWELLKTYSQTTESAKYGTANAIIAIEGDSTWIQFDTDPANLAGRSVAQCKLRYSGGFSNIPNPSSWSPIPALKGSIGSEPFLPFDSRKRYRQVLVQCPQGEWWDSMVVRTMFLINNTIVEVMVKPEPNGVEVRHWMRSARPSAKLTQPVQATDDYLAVLERMAEKAEASEQVFKQEKQKAKIEELSLNKTSDLIDLLRVARIENPYYTQRDYTQNLKLLTKREGITADLTYAYHKHPADSIVRFNLVIVIHQQLKNQITLPSEVDLAADGLVEALRDSHPWVRAEALNGLEYARRAADVEKVRVLTTDPDSQVRQLASDIVQFRSKDWLNAVRRIH